jgi:hypothetical protein
MNYKHLAALRPRKIQLRFQQHTITATRSQKKKGRLVRRPF